MYVGMHADQRLISGIFLPTFYFETGSRIELGAHWLPTLTDELQRSICLRPVLGSQNVPPKATFYMVMRVRKGAPTWVLVFVQQALRTQLSPQPGESFFFKG